jgi:two-component system, sensor histidine kinase SagS
MVQRLVTRLSFRQALNTVLVAFLLGIAGTVVEHAIYAEREREAIETQTRQVVGMVSAAAAKAAYVLDNELAGEVLTGLLSYASIYEARLTDDMGNTLASRERPRDASGARWLSEALFGREVHVSVPLVFTANRRANFTQVGTLSVTVDTHSIALRFLDRARFSIASSLATNFLLGVVLLLMFRRMVTQPILMIARDLAQVRPEEPMAHRLAIPDTHRDTEIGFLVQRTNELLGRYDDTLKQRDSYMEDLIAARQRAEEASRAKSQFLTTISHELRTPLNAIIGFSQIIRDDLASSKDHSIHSDFASEINESGQHLLGVINDIIDFSNLETGRLEYSPEPVDVRTIFDSCGRLILPRLEAAGLNFVTEVAPDTPHLYADARGLRQILMHLLSNAVKFTVGGGTISLSARPVAGGVALSVIDTGIGIEKSDLAKIFQPFWQAAPVLSRQHEGTGLGLTMVKSLVELNRGRIDVDSAPNHGTRFTVTLPAHAGRSAVPPPDTPPVDPDDPVLINPAGRSA